MMKKLLTIVLLLISSITFAQNWHTYGNFVTSPDSNKIGTTNNYPLCLMVNGMQCGLVDLLQMNNNTTFGYETGTHFVQGQGKWNACFGHWAGRNLTTGTANTLIGLDAGIDMTVAEACVAVGEDCQYQNISGSSNTAVGCHAISANKYTNFLTAFGTSALGNHYSGPFETAIGMTALCNDTTATANTAVGYSCGYGIRSGGANSIVGIEVMGDAATSYCNSIVGAYAMSAGGGNRNTGMGYQSMYYCKGTNNTWSGFQAGFNNTSGSGNIFLGYQAGFFEMGDNKLIIANSSTNNLITGNFATHTVNINSVLQLTALANPPANPEQGMIYYNTDTHLYLWNGTTWVQIDN